MARIYRTDGSEEEVDYNAVPDKLKFLQELVGGYITGFHTMDGQYGFCNDEGLLLNLPPNTKVSSMYGDLIVGNAIILNKEEELAERG